MTPCCRARRKNGRSPLRDCSIIPAYFLLYTKKRVRAINLIAKRVKFFAQSGARRHFFAPFGGIYGKIRVVQSVGGAVRPRGGDRRDASAGPAADRSARRSPRAERGRGCRTPRGKRGCPARTACRHFAAHRQAQRKISAAPRARRMPRGKRDAAQSFCRRAAGCCGTEKQTTASPQAAAARGGVLRWILRGAIISSRTAARGELSSSRISFFPLRGGRGSGSPLF